MVLKHGNDVFLYSQTKLDLSQKISYVPEIADSVLAANIIACAPMEM